MTHFLTARLKRVGNLPGKLILIKNLSPTTLAGDVSERMNLLPSGAKSIFQSSPHFGTISSSKLANRKSHRKCFPLKKWRNKPDVLFIHLKWFATIGITTMDGWMDGWMTGDFMSFSTVFESY